MSESRVKFELETMRECLEAMIAALTECEKSPTGLSKHGEGLRDGYENCLVKVEMILERCYSKEVHDD